MTRFLAALALLSLSCLPARACNPVTVAPGAGLFQQSFAVQSYGTTGCGVAAAPGVGYGVGAAPVFAPAFTPSYAPAFAPVGYAPGVVGVPVGGVNVNVFRGRRGFPHPHHGGVQVGVGRFPI